MTVATVVRMTFVMAVGAVIMHMFAIRAMLVAVAMGMAVHVAVFMTMRGAVLMGVLMHMSMGMLVLVVMTASAAVGVLMDHAILAKIATAILTHMSLLA